MSQCVQALRQQVQIEVAGQAELDRKRYGRHAAVLVKLVPGVCRHSLEDAKRGFIGPPTDQGFVGEDLACDDIDDGLECVRELRHASDREALRIPTSNTRRQTHVHFTPAPFGEGL